MLLVLIYFPDLRVFSEEIKTQYMYMYKIKDFTL